MDKVNSINDFLLNSTAESILKECEEWGIKVGFIVEEEA